ncbi:MAG TPA: NAD(P)-dependent oxidoreductase [Actinomycetota bacterium]|nr:NAD(P)-dependent oxidoreductase [Actinomycetota bacterium]
MARIAFLGLGSMGEPMAARLVPSGHEVTVWNRSPQKTKRLVELGATAVPTPADAAASADVLITMLSTPDALIDVLLGADGIASALKEQTLIDMSTVGPATVDEIRGKLPAGVTLVDAPVLGSIPAANAGTLLVFVGAQDDVYQRVRPILEAFGEVRHVGGPGAGAAMKLVVNMTLGIAMTALGEALALARAFDLDRSTVLDVLEHSPIANTVKGKRERIQSGHYPANFKLALGEKDMRLVEDAAQRLGVPLRVARAAHEWFVAGAPVAPDLDYSAVIATMLGEQPLP